MSEATVQNEPPTGTALISGAGTGIGRAIAERLAALGWRVGIGGRRQEPLEETASAIRGGGGMVHAATLDVTDPDSVDGFFRDVEDTLGPVTAVVNNAATGRYGPLEDFSPSEIHAEVATKLLGSLYMARRGIASMRSGSRSGDILFITSVAAVLPWVHHLPYAASSAGVEHAAKILKLELEGTGIRVGTLRCGETLGTDFGIGEVGTQRRDVAMQLWFQRGLLRHRGAMDPASVAEAVATALMLPRSLQYELLSVVPMAPIGEIPMSYAAFRGES